MPKVIITHNVTDIDNWLKGSSERAAALSGLGGTNLVDHVAQDGTNKIGITLEVDDIERRLAAIAEPPADMAAAMQRHGVVPPLTVYVAE
jgi:hypothetical protein